MTPRWIILVLFVLASVSVPAEPLKGAVQGEVSPDSPPVTAGVGDLVPILLPSATKFTKALEIEVDIPREILAVRSSFAVFIFQNFQIGKNGGPATGDKVGTEVLPPASKFYLEAPLIPKAGLKAAVDTAVLKLPQFDESFPVAVSIQPIDGTPVADFTGVQFSIRSRLVNSNLGAVVVDTPSLSDEDRKKLRITANGVDQPTDGPFYLEPGPYTLDVAFPGADTVTQTVVVTQAKTTEVPVSLSVETPTLVIEAPEGTQVVIDGKRLSWKPLKAFPIDRGIHTVQFVIGNTVVSDSFAIVHGGRNVLTLKFAIVLKED